jgi:hypothetical protein
MKNDWLSHSQHSSLVRNWRAKETHNWVDTDGWVEGEYHALRSPADGYLVRVSFAKYENHPEHTRVRSTNWRCEHEPNGIFSTTDARKFYRTLLEAGFVVDPPAHIAHVIAYYHQKGK